MERPTLTALFDELELTAYEPHYYDVKAANQVIRQHWEAQEAAHRRDVAFWKAAFEKATEELETLKQQKK